MTILATPALAQQGLYLRFGGEQKAHTNPGNPVDIVTAQGNKVAITPLTFFDPGGLAIGLSIGYKTERSFVELAEWQDGAEVGATFNYNTFILDTAVLIQEAKYYHGGSFGRTSLQYGFKLWGDRAIIPDKKARWEFWGYIALDVLHRPSIPVTDGGGQSWKFNRLDSAAIQYVLSTPRRSNVYGRVGSMVKAFNSKGHSIVNIGVSLSRSFAEHNTMAGSSITIKNFTDGIRYYYNIRSVGSGLYFQISKDIYINNIFNRKNKKNEAHTPSP